MLYHLQDATWFSNANTVIVLMQDNLLHVGMQLSTSGFLFFLLSSSFFVLHCPLREIQVALPG